MKKILILLMALFIVGCSATGQSPICPDGEYLDRWSTCKPIPPAVDHNKLRKPG